MGKGSHVCSSLLNNIFAHNLSYSSGSHWHPKGVLALFLCSCRRQDVLSTLYRWKEIPGHETRDQCVSPPGEKTWALQFQSSSKNGKIYTDNLFTGVPAPPESEFGMIVLHQVMKLILLFPIGQEWLWIPSYVVHDLKSTSIHWNLSLFSRAE